MKAKENVKTRALYAGSFDPFTNGHLCIVKQASEIFDYVFILVADNPGKRRHYDRDRMVNAINETLRSLGITNCIVTGCSGLIADWAEYYRSEYLIRGLRNPNDYMYEESIAKINIELNPKLKTIYFRADNEIISSSMVRELLNHEKDISKYVSSYVLEVMKNGKC
jgi:pantetheine-phosphate adenylyltransferase